MILTAIMALDWDCGLRQIKNKVQKFPILVIMGLFDQILVLMIVIERSFYGL
jgi:hypothetical protein